MNDKPRFRQQLLQIGERPTLLRRDRPAADEIAGNGNGIGSHFSWRGLSESWILKECGDIHWELLAELHRTCPEELADKEGNRLYPSILAFSLRGMASIDLMKGLG